VIVVLPREGDIMAIHRAVKLFAVVALGSASASANPSVQQPRTLGSGRPACGNVVGKGKRVACEPAPITAEAAKPAAVKPAVRSEVIQPRVLANGRPACGNVVGKSDEPVACTTAAPPVQAKPASVQAKPAPVKVTRR
jgi:hypothetical protein